MTTWYEGSNLIVPGNAVTMSPADYIYVAPNVQVASTGGNTGIYAPAGGINDAEIYGSVYGGYGIGTGPGGGNKIHVGAGGSVSGSLSGMFFGTGVDNYISNAGEIAGSAGITFNDAENTVINSGTINGTFNQALLFSKGGANSIVNSGTISAPDFYAIDISSSQPIDGMDTIDNSGTIAAGGSWYAILTGDAAASITNSGHIAGGIDFGSGTNIYDGTLGSVKGTIYAGTGTNIFTGGAGIETFDLRNGTDTVDGGGGNDTFQVNGNFANVSIDGGTGTDTVVLAGDYSAGLVIKPEMMINVEVLKLTMGNSYKLTTNDSVLAAGATLTIDGSALLAGDALVFNGGKETNGHLKIIDGLGADTFTVGSQSDKIIIASASDSTSTHYDTVVGWNFGADKWNIPGGPGTITAIDTALATGTLSTASFDANLTTAMTGHLAAHSAILFTPNAGTLSGQKFMVVDFNGTAGYQAGQDLVIRLQSSTGTLAVGGFI